MAGIRPLLQLPWQKHCMTLGHLAHHTCPLMPYGHHNMAIFHYKPTHYWQDPISTLVYYDCSDNIQAILCQSSDRILPFMGGLVMTNNHIVVSIWYLWTGVVAPMALGHTGPLTDINGKKWSTVPN